MFGGAVDQEYLFQARQMQALSLGFHIVLVCFGVAFPALVLFVEGLYLRTRDTIYRTVARRWSKTMLVLFAVGVVSGTILSFELGLLWPGFMAEFGDVFGLAFTLEGFAFFLEAIFIAVYVYGWDRLPRRIHFLTGIPIVAAGILGALFVLSVNSWMNDPTGFDLVGGEVTNVDPLAALFNDNLWHTFVHMLLAAYLVAGFATAGVYAVAWLRGKRTRYHRIALVVPLTAAALAAPVQLVVGDWAARTVAEKQPVKLAAIEGVGSTTEGAPLHVLGWYRDGEVEYGIGIPRLLSLLAYHDPSAAVRASTPSRPRTGPPSTPSASPSRRWWGSARHSRRSPSCTSSSCGGAERCRGRAGSTARSPRPGRSLRSPSSAAGSRPRSDANRGSCMRSCERRRR